MKTIPVLSNARMEELLDKETILDALDAYGVDNWEGYSEALKEYRKAKEIEKAKQDFIDELVETLSGYIEEPAGRGCGYWLRSEGYDELYAFVNNYNITKKS